VYASRRTGQAMRGRHGIGSWLATLSVLAVVGTLVPPYMPAAGATPQGDNGRIAIRRYFNQQHTHGAIFTIKPDGTGLFQVTHPRPGFLTTEPDWSPNGRWIVYYRNAKGQDQYEGPDRIYKIRATGTHRTYLSGTCTGSCVSDYGPSFSPDGTHIVFNRDTGQCNSDTAPCLTALYVMRSDGTRVRRVTQRHATPSHHRDVEDHWAQYSPHGFRLVFERHSNEHDAHAIFTVRLDGTGVHRLTPWRLDAAQPDWSPNGRWILFRSYEAGQQQNNLFLVHPDGSDRHRITHTVGGTYEWFSASFSPDGRFITTARSPGQGKPGNPDVYVMREDGTRLRNITNSRIWDSGADWGPGPQ
jgi:TolB protein